MAYFFANFREICRIQNIRFPTLICQAKHHYFLNDLSVVILQFSAISINLLIGLMIDFITTNGI
jgi:hypothetical protein